MQYKPVEPQPPFDCTCGAKHTAWKYLERHLRHKREAAKAAGVKNIHYKVRSCTHAEAAVKAGETQRRRRANFMKEW